MKKLFLFLFAAVLSISMFAQTGKTKAQAIPYNWSTGIHVSSEAHVGKWYVVMLKKEDGGPFNANGKTDAGLTNINVSVVNPLDEEADIDVMAYIGDNETNRHFKLAAGGIKSMTFGAGMFIKMGIDRVYLYLVMDVTITQEEAEAHEAVNVNVTPVESENSVVFIPDTFRWNNGWPNKNLGITIPANKETWVMFDFATTHSLQNNHTYKFYIEKNDATPITVDAGVSYDCPASSIQEQSQELNSASTAKILDEAKLSMIPDTMYVRIKAAQELRIYAQQVAIPAPTGDPIFNINNGNAGQPAIEVLLWDSTSNTEYRLKSDSLVYFVKYATLQAEENYYRQIEVTNNGSEEVTIVGKASKTPDTNGNVYSVATKTVTIPAGQTYTKKIDKTMQNVVGSQADDKIYALGPEFPNVTFKLTQVPEDPDYCKPAQAEALTLPATGPVVKAQSAGTQWYKVDITEAMTAETDITLTLESNQEVNVTIDVAAECALGEPTQTYTGKSTSTTKTLSYSVIKDVKKATDNHYYVYVRVKTDKAISVKAELVPVNAYIIWDGTKWSNGIGPKKEKAAYIQGPLTVTGGQIIEASTLDLNINGSMTIKSGASVFVGNGGISIASFSQGVTVEDGGMLLISPECSYTYNAEPEVKVHKTLHLGQQTEYDNPDPNKKATLRDLHEFITVPVTGAYDVEARYYYWDRVSGWLVKKSTSEDPNKACSPFVGYHVFTTSTDAHYGDYDAVFEGKLAPNKNQSFTTGQIGWYAFGNSWLAPIKLSYLLDALAEKYTSEGETHEANQKAVHTYVTSPMQVPGLPNEGIIKDNYYIPLTAEIAANIGVTEIAPMQGFFLFTEGGATISVDYTKVWNDATGYGSNTPSPAPKHNRVADERNKAAVVFNGGGYSDFVYMIEGDATNANKMLDANLAIYAGNGLGQVAKDNLIGTTLSIKTNNATEYTLSFGWLNGETMYLRDLQNGVLIEMTEDNKYTFTAEPNTVSERFQVVGRNDAPTAIENTFIEGTNKVIENGKVVIIKNGVKYNVLGAQL